MSARHESTDADWLARIRARLDQPYAPVIACDPVNETMIRHWCEAHGIVQPRYSAEGVPPGSRMIAPASMLQVWLQPGPSDWRPEGSAQVEPGELIGWFEQAGYPGLIGVSVEQHFYRPLYCGEHLSSVSTLTFLSELKNTGLGQGYFFTVRQDVYSADRQEVAQINFRQLCYAPKKGS